MAQSKGYTREQVEAAIQSGNIWEVQKSLDCSKGTVEKYLKQFDISTPEGFYSTGKPLGCPKGTKRSLDQVRAMSERAFGSKNPFFGKKHSEATKELMKNNHADFSGEKNPFKRACNSRPKILQSLSEKHKNRWASYSEEQRNEIRRKFSLAQTNSEYHKNNATFKNHQHGHYSGNKGGKHFYRSSWELQAAIIFDEHEKVETYQYEPYTLGYTTESGERRYSRPDFLVALNNRTSVLVEIKPESLLDLNNNRCKIDGYRVHCATNKIAFLLVHKKELNELKEIINAERFERPGVDSVLQDVEKSSQKHE